MALSCGFYNSLNGDRKYNARQFGDLFDGIIRDGIFMSIGTSMMVRASEGMTVTIGVGHAWFNKTWTTNDSPMPLVIPQSEILLDRIDTIVLEINTNEEVRDNTIKLIKGVPSSEPVRPDLVTEEGVYWYPLCDVYVMAEINLITQADITNRVGTIDTPFVTGILQTMSIDNLIAQWEEEWNLYVRKIISEGDRITDEMNVWKVGAIASFNEWFQNVQYILSEDAGGKLQVEIDRLNKYEFEQRYGMTNKTTSILKDIKGDTVSITENYEESKAITTFETRDDGSKIITTMLYPNEGSWDYKKTVSIKQINLATDITESYYRILKEMEGTV